MRLGLFLTLGVFAVSSWAAGADSLPGWPSDRPPVPKAPADLPAPLVPTEPTEVQLPAPAADQTVHAPVMPETVFHGMGAPASHGDAGYRLSFGSYGWLPETYGQIGIGNTSANLAVSTRDMLNLIEHDVHFLFSGIAELEAGDWSVTASGIYLYAGFDNSIRRLRFNGNASQAIVDVAVGHEIVGLAELLGMPTGSEIELTAGIRYWLLGGAVTATGPRGNSATRGNDVDWVDPVFGARMTYEIMEGLRARVRGDIGGFGWWNASERTWNIEALLEQRLSPHLTMGAGYRLLDVYYQRGSGRDRFLFDAQMRGPLATLTLDF